MAGIWIIAEKKDLALELLSKGLFLAKDMQCNVTVLTWEKESAQDFINCGVNEVLLLGAQRDDQTLSSYVSVIAEEASKSDPDLIMVSATFGGKELAAALAGRLKTGLCSNCIGMVFKKESGLIEMERMAYGGAAVQKVNCVWRPAMATIPPRTFDREVPANNPAGKIRELPTPIPTELKVIGRKSKDRASKDITEAKVIVCVGRGFENKEDLSFARDLAEALGGDLACTRPISEEMHWLPEELCIGLSGVQVKPQLYIGLGVSGQIQHVTGINNSKVICAINKDENAPIFSVSDLGIVGDLYEVTPKLIKKLKG